MERRSQFGWCLAGLVLFALGLRVVVALWWQSRLGAQSPFALPDSDTYWELARTLAAGEPYQYHSETARVFRTPGYPALLAPLFWWWNGNPPIIAARLVSAVCGAAAVAATAWLAVELSDRRTALLAAAGAAVYPGAIAMSVVVLSEAPFCPLVLVQLAALLAAERQRGAAHSLAWSGAAGIAAGLATLMRPSWLLFTPLAALWQIAAGPWQRDRWCHAGLMLATLALVITPWWVRNALVTGTFVPTTLQVGASLYDGLRPGASGGSDMRFVPEFEAAQRADDAAQGLSAAGFEGRLDRRFRSAALQWACANPGEALRLAGVKFIRIWNVWPNAQEFSSPGLRFVIAAGYLPIMCGAIASLASRLRPGRGEGRLLGRELVCLLPAVYLTLLHMVFVGSLRYREPAMLPLVVLAAGMAARTFYARPAGAAA